ncbi:MAG: Aquaporin Z [uncultured Acetobacteraceae bacterium]|uniref:Aquaporin Z n=1 Tax=uncultured Acetobacteraceae bacterium TaxID=169975 RepID=A0A6J4HQI2_9PROT|nr:MAG: Aquaporin Z [uncultured Acetobacteraceae bacterium]
MTDRLPQRLVAEAIGTGLLLAAVVGSGIMAERLAGGNAGVALLANTLATAGALAALILTFGPVSGAHFNPAVTVALAWREALPWRVVPGYLAAQLVGAVLGVWLAHLMFELPVVQASTRVRTGFGQWAGEFTATFALLSVVWGCVRHHPHATPHAVACVIAGAYWFTSSTSFANPAVTAARALSDTFAGVRPADVPAFVAAQALGAAAATALSAWFAADRPVVAPSLAPPEARGAGE